MAKRTKKAPTPPVTTDLYVDYETNTWVTSPRDPSDEWSRESTDSEHTLQFVSIANEGDYPTVTYPGVVEPGEKVYLVYAVYGTGDSFGHDDSSRLELISIHKDLDVAHWNYKMLSTTEGKDYNYSVTLSQDNGLTWLFHVPRLGYFESLTYVKVAGFTVKPRKAASSQESWYDEYN